MKYLCTVIKKKRVAARERYLGRRDEQRKAMLEFVGTRKRASGSADSEQYIRDLRRSDRLDRLGK